MAHISLDSSREKTLDPCVSSTSPYGDINLPTNQDSTAISSNPHDNSSYASNGGVGDCHEAGVPAEELNLSQHPSNLLADTPETACNDSSTSPHQLVAASDLSAAYLPFVILTATRQDASRKSQPFVSGEQAARWTLPPIQDGSIQKHTLMKPPANKLEAHFEHKCTNESQALTCDNQNSDEEEFCSDNLESIVDFTMPPQEQICSLAKSIVIDWMTLEERWASRQSGLITCTGSGSPTNDVSGNRTGNSWVTLKTSSNVKKRQRSSDSDDDREDRPRKQRKSVSRPVHGSDTTPIRLLACPFYKYNPARFSMLNTLEKEYRGCSNRYLPNIGRLKQHLRRNHERPHNYCGRCYETFPTRTGLDLHTNQALRCQEAEPRYSECLTDEQAMAIRKKYPLLSIEENWYRIWRILFPDAIPPESPYVDTAIDESINRFLVYFRQQAPACIRAGLQAAGIVAHPELERATTSRVLEEAISQILIGYHSTSEQSAADPDTRSDPPRDFRESLESTTNMLSSSESSIMTELPFSTFPASEPVSLLSHSSHLPMFPTSSIVLANSTPYNSVAPYAHSADVLSPGTFPDRAHHLDHNNSAFWTYRPSQADSIYPQLGTEPQAWDWDDMLAPAV